MTVAIIVNVSNLDKYDSSNHSKCFKLRQIRL